MSRIACYHSAMRPGVVLVVMLLGACRSSATAPCPDPPPARAAERTAAERTAAAPRSLEDVAAAFRRLRGESDRAHAASPRWNDATDSWGSDLHVVMNELKARLGASGTPRATVIALMGEPDRIAPPGSDLWWSAREHAQGDQASMEMLVYCWRGLHDYLYFIVRDGRIVRADWWMAGE